MRDPAASRTARSFVAATLVLAASALGALAGDGGAQIPEEIREKLVAVVDQKITELAEKKDEEGRRTMRGRSPKVFTPAGDDRYRVTFYQDIVDGDKLTSERHTLTLAKGEDGEWKIVGDELIQTYDELWRPPLDHESFVAFDRFEFDAEGLKVTAGPGTGVISIRPAPFLGRYFSSLEISADDIEYDYAPPVDTNYYERYRIQRDELADKLVFEPGRVRFWATPDRFEKMLDEILVNRREVSLDDIDDELREDVIERRERIREGRTRNNLGGFDFPIEPDLDAYLVQVFKKKSDDHFLGLLFNPLDAKEVTVLLSGAWPALYRYYSEETRKSGIDLRTLEHRPDFLNREYDIVAIDGEVELGLEDPEKMVGDVTYEIRAHEDLESIDFGIFSYRRGDTDQPQAEKDPVINVHFVQDGDGNDLSFFQAGPNSGRVLFAEPIAKDQTFTIRIKWENANGILNYSHSYKGMPRGGWMPFVRFADMIDRFDMTIKVPAKYKTLGIGEKISEEVVDGVSITKWTAHHPVTFPTIIYGDYYEMPSKTVAKKLDGTVVPVTIHVDKIAMSDFEIRPKQLEPLVEHAANSINLYTQYFQVDYPFAKLDLVNDPVGGGLYGQAPSSIIYLGSGVFRSMASYADVGRMDATRISRFLKSVVAHEVAHQWWGASTANANQGNYWFVESLAEYSSALFLEQGFGKDEYDAQVEEWRDAIVAADLYSSVQEASEMWSGGGFGSYQAAVYNKGPYAFHILRSTFGDEKFRQFMVLMAKAFAKREIVTGDMVKLSEFVFGEGRPGSMDWFWGQWIRGVGLPEYRYDLDSRRAEDGGYVIEGKIQQRVVYGKDEKVLDGEYFRGLVPIVVKFRDGSEEAFPVLIEGPETDVRFRVPREPRKIVFNGRGEMLVEHMREGSF